MATANPLINQLNQQVAVLNRRIASFFSFISTKITHFKSLTLGEQISFLLVGAGLVLMLISVILFIL